MFKTFVADRMLAFLAWCLDHRSMERPRILELLHEQSLTASTVYGPRERLVVGPRVSRANTLFNTRSGTITIGQGVMFGHNCMVLTGVHDYARPGETRERVTLEDAGRDIVIGDGAWIASGAIVVGPCRIGKNAVIGSGSVVVTDIPDMVLAAGNPARVIRALHIAPSAV